MYKPQGYGSGRFAALWLGFLLSQLALAATSSSALSLREINDHDVVVLRGDVHPLVEKAADFGRTDPALRMERMTLLLRRDPEKEAALERLVAEQHEPGSASFHRWRTPEELGAEFGRSPEEVDLVAQWLTSQGFTIDEVGVSRVWINFSGPVTAVNRAFHTEMRDYRVGGAVRHANATAPALPRALADLVEGVATLHDFPLEAHHRSLAKEPRVLSGGQNFLGPADFATIYHLPNAYTGTGQTIAIVARSNLLVDDVRMFRSHFGLPARDPQIIVNGFDPGTVILRDEVEVDLDTEWAGAVAPDATIVVVVSATTSAADGVFLSAQYIVNHNLAPVVSVSFGLCEQLMTASELSSYQNLWLQAAAQGMTVVVSSGDQGAAGCSSNTGPHQFERAVSGLCASPWNVCVGGTQFNEGTNPSLYWGSDGSALRYIPEVAWNEPPLSATGGGATGGGASLMVSKPTWQAGLGVPADGRRDVPDLSFSAAADHDAYQIVQGLGFTLTGIGGTSASAPAFAGLMARVVQKTGQRQGNPNPVLYQLAAAQNAGTISGVFHDTLVGSNSFNGVSGFSCTTGYDLATGLGSVDGAALVAAWPLPGATLNVQPASGTGPLATLLTAVATGEGYGTINYSFWWHCPFAVSTVQQALAQCGDPRVTPGIGAKFDTVTDLQKTVSWTYAAAGTYKPLVIVERGAGSSVATATVAVTGTPACASFTLSPASATPDASASSRQVAVVGVPAGCQGGGWTAGGNGSWLTVTPASGTGPGTVTVAWTANPASTSRSASAAIAGNSFAVTQAGVASAPLPPFLLAPGAAVSPGTTTPSLTPTFFWQSAAGADSYQLELSDATGVFPLQTIAVPATAFTWPSALADNHAYTWRMRSHGVGGWGAFGVYYYFSTYTGNTTGDFTLAVSPTSGGVSPGASAAFTVNTATLVGSAQTLTLRTGSLPAGIAAGFSANPIASGGQSTLTLNVGAGTAPGSYTIAVSATSNLNVTKTVSLGLTVNPLPGTGEPAICLTPPGLGFSDQTVGTSSPVQLVTLRNCGNGPLHVASIGASPDFFLGSGSIAPPVDLPEGTATTFQVGFAPLAPGPRTGIVRIVSNAPGSPTDLALAGTGLPAPVTTGTVSAQATLNGEPFTGFIYFSLTGPGGGTVFLGDVPLTRPDQAAGTYSVTFLGSPAGGGTLTSITPASTQTLTAGGGIVFTFNFTAVNDFGVSCPTATNTATTVPLVTPIGGSASVPLTIYYIRGGNQTINLAVAGLPPGATATIGPPVTLVPSGPLTLPATLSVATAASTPPGVYALTITATNQDGTVHALTGDLVVVTNAAPRLVSVGPGGVLADGYSDYPTLSADGRYLAFFSLASTLVPGDTNNAADVFVRDRQTGVTSRVSISDSGAQADDWSGLPVISANGRYVAFRSLAGNLVPGGRRGVGDIYVRDLQLGQTTQVSLSSSGVPADSGCLYPSISGDGRFVAFNSDAGNLVPGVGGGVQQVYVRDRWTGTTALVSAANDGSAGDAYSMKPVISGDGRYVAFISQASNVIPGATAFGRQVFLRDLRAGTTLLVGAPPDGSAPNALSGGDSADRLAMSLDGRYVAFASAAWNLVPGDTNFQSDAFVWDRVTRTTILVSVANDGTLLYGGGALGISADGRYVSFRLSMPSAPSNQTAVRDLVTGRTVVYSVGPGNALETAFCSSTALSADGQVLAFASNAPNLVAGDTNGQQDIFDLALPTNGPAIARSLVVSPAVIPGGGTATGAVTLSAPAPAGGATVALAGSSLEVQVPAFVTVAAGATTATFAISTLPVSSQIPVSLTASYGGGSPWALLTLQPSGPARIEVFQGDGQSAALGTVLGVPLSARVLDAANNPVATAVVQWTAPASGPSGLFAGGVSSALVATDASGISTAPAFTANNVLGSYAVLASVAGVASPAVFNLANRTGFYYTLAPCRVLDTRNPTGPYGAPAFAAGANRTFNLAGRCGVPATAQAVTANLTVTAPTQAGDLRAFPGDAPVPLASIINFSSGQTRTNNAIFPLSKDGNASLALHNDMGGGSVQVIVDVTGYFQ